MRSIVGFNVKDVQLREKEKRNRELRDKNRGKAKKKGEVRWV